jgi:hypothetical protein
MSGAVGQRKQRVAGPQSRRSRSKSQQARGSRQPATWLSLPWHPRSSSPSRTADNVVLCSRFRSMDNFRWLTEQAPPLAPGLWICIVAQPQLGSWCRSHRLNPATCELTSGGGDFRVAGACHHSLLCSFLRQNWWWLDLSLEDLRLFKDES